MTKELFKGSVVLNPVPAVVITSRNKDGVNNAFTVAWTGTICTNPPMLSISIRPERLSYEYIKETMEFTVNLPNTFQVRETDYCGVISGRDVDKMKELGVEKSYMIMSADLKTIETVEKLDPTIKTGYTISLQIGNFTSQKVDFYAIEDFSYNELLARTAHKNGKKIYVWTINSRDDIERYLETSTDGVITDYTASVRKIEKELASDDSYLDYFLRLTNLSWIEKL